MGGDRVKGERNDKEKKNSIINGTDREIGESSRKIDHCFYSKSSKGDVGKK